MKSLEVLLAVAALVILTIAAINGEVWEENEHEVLIRTERGTKGRDGCKYTKGQWSECNPVTNMKTRTLMLKKGNQDACESKKVIEKKCKKACRYEKGEWSECNENGEMSRTDKIKMPTSDASCEPVRHVTKGCKNSKKSKSQKGEKKSGRRNNRQ